MLRTWTLVGIVAAVIIGCVDEKPAPTLPDPPDELEVAGPVFSEKRISASIDGTKAELTIELGMPRDVDRVQGTIGLWLGDLTGNLLSQTTQSFDYGASGTTVSVTLDGLPVGLERADLVQYNVHYKVEWEGGKSEGRRSLFDAVPKLEVILVTEDEIEVERGGHFTLFVLDPSTGLAVADATVRVAIETEDGETEVAEVTTDEAGRASGSVEAPQGKTGESTLKITVEAGGAIDESEVAIEIVRDQKILLTTDKPMYQPGQQIHLRALALHAGDKHPEANQEIIFEVEDSKGNKLAKELAKTDEFGVASTEIRLAKELNMGQWKLRAILGDTTTEKTIKVDRYTLPKFGTDVSLDEPWYKPGQTVHVQGEARYFFGKPVAGGTVKIVASTFDIDFTPFADLSTTTNESGLFTAELTVPSYVVGTALQQGKGALKVDITVTDTAGQEFGVSKSAPVAEGGVSVALVPESGTLATGLENQVYVVTSDPLGSPVAATVTVEHEDTTVAELTTSEGGLGAFTIVPSEVQTRLNVTATAGDDTVTVERILSVGADSATVLLRTNQSVYSVGDTITAEVLVGEAKDRVFLDVVHRGRTVQLQALDVADGKAAYAFDVDNALEGDVMLSVFYITDKGTIVRDQKLVYVQSANELILSMSADKASYLPGEKATLDIEVRDLDGAGVASAVGVQIVDEAVFALTEVQPGLLKMFFELARELAEPQVHLKGYSATGVIQSTEATESEPYQDRARVAFAALGDSALHSIQKDSYQAVVSAMHAVLQPYMDTEKTRISERFGALADAGVLTWENLGAYLTPMLAEERDLWNKPYRVEVNDDSQVVTITTNGPDEREGTLDDAAITLSFWDVLYGHRSMNVGAGGPAGGGGDGGDDWDADGVADFAEGEPAPPMEPGANQKADGGSGVKVRQFFPETLYVNPAVITDSSGKATIEVAMADSITEWRMTGLASAKTGLLGSGSAGIIVFQDFFVDIDFPVAITRNDAFSVPVALYNYLDEQQTVNLSVEPAEWLEVTGPTSQTLTLEPGQVTGLSFDIRALSVGVHGLTIVAAGSTMSDAVKRTVDVRPDGKVYEMTASARFPGSETEGEPAAATVVQNFVVPDGNIDGSQKLLVKVYPGFLSQMVEGMDSMLRLPGG